VVDTYAPGAVLVVLAALVQRWTAKGPPPNWANESLLPLLACGGIAAHLVLASATQPMAWGRALASLAFLFFLLLGSSSFATLLARIPEARFHRAMRRLGWFMLVVALLGLVGFAPPTLTGEPWSRPYFPFTEPAGFALPVAPVLMYLCVMAKGSQRTWMLVVAVLGMALITTLTLAVAVALIAAVSLRKWQLIVFALLMGAALTQVDLSYYTERLDFLSEDNDNLSNLVYVQGWQLLFEGLQRSHWLGQGFQQLGMHGTDVDAAAIINAMMQGEDLNLLDGGFLLPKIGAEFGIFGLVAVALVTWRSFRSLLVLRRVAAGKLRLPAVVVFAHVILVALLLRLYVRSGGYFNGEMILTLAALWILARQRRSRGRPVAQARPTTRRPPALLHDPCPHA
jgi:hypothetical protein